jgi:diadenosine tetraphosphatase ApaH/serine/threonine PP2A family protein phosphatase
MGLDFVQVLEKIERGDVIDENTVISILRLLEVVLLQECNVLTLSRPIVICGDIHGQLDDLLELFSKSGDKNTQTYLFMGDYVDRGYHSLNTFLYLVCLKLKRRNSVWMLRGNHESRQVSRQYGFYNECLLNYGHAGSWALCNDVFDMLPLAALIDLNVFCVHGGLSPDLPLIEMISKEKRQQELPGSGPMCDLCWSDPEDVRKWRLNQRGAGYLFGENEVKKFNSINNIRLVCRSHQLVQEGYKWYFGDKNKNKSDPEGNLITVWSAPNYSYRSGNVASIMMYGFWETDKYQLVVFDPAENRIVPNDIPVAGGYFA